MRSEMDFAGADRFDKARSGLENIGMRNRAGARVAQWRHSMGAKLRLLASITASVAFACVALGAKSANAIEQFEVADHPFWTIDEVRVGGFKQAVDNAPHEGGPGLNLEVLGGRFTGGYENSILNFFLTPRPHVGTTIAFGKTDEFYWGATWDAKVIDRTFFETSFGGTYHDGPLNTPHEASYGCSVNFRESASLGFALTPEWRLMATVDHMSQAGICQPNRGLTNAGVRLGYKF